MTERDPSLYVFWLASRSAGIVAFVLVATSVLLGLYLAANLGHRRVSKRVLVKTHEQVALAALVAIAAHGLLLLGDAWLSPGIGGLAIPFTMSYRPIFTGIGQVAGPARLRPGTELLRAAPDRSQALAQGSPADARRLRHGRGARARRRKRRTAGSGSRGWSSSPRFRWPACSSRATGRGRGVRRRHGVPLPRRADRPASADRSRGRPRAGMMGRPVSDEETS